MNADINWEHFELFDTDIVPVIQRHGNPRTPDEVLEYYSSTVRFHTFKDNSKLKSYLSVNCPELVDSSREIFDIKNLLTAFKVVVSVNRLLDPTNKTIVICDSELEEVLQLKSFHSSQTRYCKYHIC
jgi:hypothetical protein